MMTDVAFTMLNAMADSDFETALDRHVEWGLSHLDLKGGILGKRLIDLTDDEAHQAARMVEERKLSVYCLSTTLFDEDIEAGEDIFLQEHFGKLDRLIEIAQILRPHFVRLLAAKTSRRAEIADSVDYLRSEQVWLIDLYRQAIEKLTIAGCRVTVENECHNCLMSNPEEIVGFFDCLGCGDAVGLAWDVQNLWQMGTPPTLHVYEQLKPLISYYHLKGGKSEFPDGPLKWRSSLEDASWPVEEITNQVIADGVSPVICLNGSHGERKTGYDYETVTERDLGYVKHKFGGRT